MISKTASEAALKFREMYAAMKSQGQSPKEICHSIARQHGLSSEQIRLLIGFGQKVCICKVCWKEFQRQKTINYESHHLCQTCRIVYDRQSTRKSHLKIRRNRHASSKFMSADELRRYLRHECGMTEEESLEALADVRVGFEPQRERFNPYY